MQDEDATRWGVHREITDDYALQMASRHKVLDRKSGKMRWKPKTEGAADHYRACEILQCVAADMANVAVMQPMEANDQAQERAAEKSAAGVRRAADLDAGETETLDELKT